MGDINLSEKTNRETMLENIIIKMLGPGEYVRFEGESGKTYNLMIKNIDENSMDAIVSVFQLPGEYIKKGEKIEGGNTIVWNIGQLGPDGLLVLNYRLGRATSVPRVEVNWQQN